MNQFWLVWNPNRNAPSFKHESDQAAIQEAERLARQCPGETFFVMESICGRVVDNMQKITFDPETPF